MELSKKIEMEPERNSISNIQKNAKGTSLTLRILEIEIMKYQKTSRFGIDNISDNKNTDFDRFKSLMYTI